jgi:hypothetical protein
MIKKILLVLLVLSIALDAKNLVRMKNVESAPTKQEAIEGAFWNMFEDALGTVLGGNSNYDSNTAESFKSDMEKDFLAFRKMYFRSPKIKCNNNGEEGYECMVLASIDLDKLRSKVSKKNNSTTTMGRNALENIVIVLIDDVNTDLSRGFTKAVHADSLDSGTDLRVEKKGTQVGSKGNKCTSIKSRLHKYARGSAAYRATQKKIKECKENSDVEYMFKLTQLNYHLDAQKDRYGSYTGSLTYRLSMINTKTGRENNAIREKTVSSFDSNKDKLRSKLYEKAAALANAEMTDNMLQNTSKKERKKKRKKIQKYEYYYTVILTGMTNDSSDRKKRKIMKETIKEMGGKAKKNIAESSDFEQVYNFGTHEEIDLEEFSDKLYDMAEALNFNINVSEKSDTIVVVQFR